MDIDLIECPGCKAQEVECNFRHDAGKFYCSKFEYPIVDGIPDLRLPCDQTSTSYDQILPEWSPPVISDPKALLAPYGITPEMVRDKTVCIAGAGGGAEILALSAFAPKVLHVIEFSGFVRELAIRFPGAHYYQGDVCNMPFKKASFDLIVSGGIIQHTRSPELSVRSMARCLKKDGALAVANTYRPNLHNRRVTINRNRYEFHKMAPNKAKRKLKRNTFLYYLLIRTGLWRAHRRVQMPGILEYCNIPGHSFSFYYENALDYYLCTNRHTISAAEFEGYCNQIGAAWARTPKGFLVASTA